MAYSITEWVAENKGKDPAEMLVEVDRIHSTLKAMESKKGKKPEGFYDFLRAIQGFYWFISNLSKPGGQSLEPFKPIIEDWLEKRIISKSLFDELF